MQKAAIVHEIGDGVQLRSGGPRMSDQSQNVDAAISATARSAEFFNHRDWGYNQDPAKTDIRIGFSGDNGRWQCLTVDGPEHKTPLP